MPSSSILLGDRSRELNRRSAKLRVESTRLNDESVALRRKVCVLPIREAIPSTQQPLGGEASASVSSARKQKMLHSWKEIASYIGFGVRSIQRYERFLKLPIRRFSGSERSYVSAFTTELDRWMQTAGTQPIRRTEWESVMKEIEELRTEVIRLRNVAEETHGSNT